MCRVRRGTSSAGGGHASESPETSMETRMGVQFVPEALWGQAAQSEHAMELCRSTLCSRCAGPWDPIAFVNSL